MYGNITSHLYVFKRGPFITEIPRQLFKGQRTLRPGITHHLARSVASEDTSVPLRGGPGGRGPARPGPSQGRGGQARAPGREPGPGVGSAPWPPSICPACLGAKWGARGPLPSLQQPVLECGQQGVNNRSPTGTREPPAGLREGRPAPGHWGHGSGATPGRQTLPPSRRAPRIHSAVPAAPGGRRRGPSSPRWPFPTIMTFPQRSWRGRLPTTSLQGLWPGPRQAGVMWVACGPP